MRRRSTRVSIICLVAAPLAFGLAGLVFAWSGFYNVAASHPHFAITTRLLEFGLRRSVETHSVAIAGPSTDDVNLVRLGAGHFDGGCAPCHGTPEAMHNPVVQNMLPQPPKLTDAASHWTAEQLFWIVKNGLKFTGMPAWVAQQRDDEVWAVVAFLKALPDMAASDYRAAAAGNVSVVARTGLEIARYGAGTEAISQCARCHGLESEPPVSNRVPKLAGQSQAYLDMTLRSFAAGSRQSGIMQPVAAALREEDIAKLAKYYAGLRPANVAAEPPPPDQIERGRAIALTGVPENGVPPCLACHGGTRAATFPMLFGQYSAYLRNQLQLWRKGLRSRSAQGAVMAAIATRLTDEQILAVTAWFESASPSPQAEASSPPAPSPPAPSAPAQRRRRR